MNDVTTADFETLFKQAEEQMAMTFTSTDMIPFAADIIALIESKNDQTKYTELFKQAWEKEWGGQELISICMHKLRWPELKNYFEQKYEEAKANDDWDAESSLLGIVESFEEDWGDAQDLYFEFFQS